MMKTVQQGIAPIDSSIIITFQPYRCQFHLRISCPIHSYVYDIGGGGIDLEERFFVSFIHCFFIAFGVVLGGTVIGSVGSFLTGDAPLNAMSRIAKSIKIWAIVAAIGGTFDAIENFQKGFLDGSTMDLLKQFFYILSAMIGVKTATMFISWLTDGEV